MLALLLLPATLLGAQLVASYDEVVAPGAPPVLRLKLLEYPAAIQAECAIGGRSLSWENEDLAPRQPWDLALPVLPGVTEASCQVLARFADGQTEGLDVAMRWRVVAQDRGDPSRVSLDLVARRVELPAPFAAVRAVVEALGAEDAALLREEIALRARSGLVVVRWTKPGAERAAKLRIELLGAGGESIVYELAIPRRPATR